MAFSAGDRVRVTSENSAWRHKLGTVLRTDDDGNHVRLDGHAPERTVLIRDEELVETNFDPPITY